MSATLIQGGFEDVSPEYAAFVEKFKPKKTTDDCYTPENIYNVVADWAAKKYGFDKAQIVRPFWPGGDYQKEKYADDCVVVDNPPFSILSKICQFYNAHKIQYFLFAPALTLFNNNPTFNNYICCGEQITYANGAKVPTSFVTSFGEYKIENAPDLFDLIKAANRENEKKQKKQHSQYIYPPDILTAAGMNYLATHHTHFKVKKQDVVFLRRMDAHYGTDKTLFGGGFLLSERAAAERAAAERAAAERAAAERAAAHRWELSDREREIQRLMAKGLNVRRVDDFGAGASISHKKKQTAQKRK